jgi:Fe-S-cluster-containing dehydrogenase component/DMSO reductase anchor subunit
LTAIALVDRSAPAAPAWGPAGEQPGDLLAGLLRQQQDLSAVERFAQRHASTTGVNPRTYRDLLPATPPKDGEQYAFEVDLDLCSGCKACVTACHNQNGLDDDESFREVGFLHGGNGDLTVIQHVTTACHHCLQPACMTACPVNAYEKDPLTGIVRHLDDQCFGCQYCTLACPYDVPKYNREKGIIRKCDMCSQRLAAGEAPACAQACPHQAIRIRTVKCEDVLHDCETNFFLPGAPEPQHTLPTTNYKTARPLPRNLLPADYYAVRSDHAHPALVVMLVLTQLSVGTFAAGYLMQQAGFFDVANGAMSRAYQVSGALVVAIVALAASTLHLGRPQYAYRALLGFGHSWLSREIVFFGLFALLAAIYAICCWQSDQFTVTSDSLQILLGGATVFAGLAGVGCSVMIYRSTRRPCWSGVPTACKFLLTTVVLGASGSMVLAIAAAAFASGFDAGAAMQPYSGSVAQALVFAALSKLGIELLQFVPLSAANHTPLKRSAMLMIGPLRPLTIARFVFGLTGIACLAAIFLASASHLATGTQLSLAAVAGFACLLAGEICERQLFFTASVAPRMPGGVAG